MISRANKFPTRTQFLQFRSRARQIATPHTRIYLLESSISSRLSVIIPVKVNKRAVVRNSLKRLVYDAVWRMLGAKNIDCIVLFKPIALLKGKLSEDLVLAELSIINNL